MFRIFLLFYTAHLFAADSFYYSHKERVPLQPYIKDDNHTSKHFSSKARLFKTRQNTIVAVDDTIIVKCYARIPCKKDIKSLQVRKISRLAKGIYLVTIKPSEDVFERSQRLLDLPSVEFAEPNFTRESMRR